ncbi:hypothetical protein DQ397_004013 [Pseudomonas sp. CK-NBRI-02]|uniref:Uncharacterized protein n=1 Tax=Pseudomonas guariconensis TaxID=1288410 RepID=A0AAX0VR76_9PSED|nr:hypothetical protein CXG49_20830 [Pseudomonas guariconensis]PLV22131.1 hypothetical protein CXG53_21150 [Pseudomonas guariconensis]PLV30400.1 hypothetical protein CXG51_06420 [Pseudomonas guariconensis]TYO70811.1 hypothetical protein DQ397_004013 [Pseudomonas sp. CK-NBRI-02]
MICQLAQSRASARNRCGRKVACHLKSCQFEPGGTWMTTPTCAVMRGQVTGAVNHRIMRALYMEVRRRRTGKSLFGSAPLTTQECLV